MVQYPKSYLKSLIAKLKNRLFAFQSPKLCVNILTSPWQNYGVLFTEHTYSASRAFLTLKLSVKSLVLTKVGRSQAATPLRKWSRNFLNTLIKANELANEPRDISWLKEQIKSNIFDLYGILTIDDKKYCFGCVQAKTSIRDRVTRDREPSIHAMQSFFWSVVFVLDGDFLRLPKFVSMINGGSEEFRENGWHGMYVLSVKETNQRIYPLNMDFEIFKNHALQAAEQWQKRRQWFDSKWMACDM